MKHIKLFESFFKSTNESKDNSKTAVIALFNPEGKLLALKRGITAPWKPGHWNITGGMVGQYNHTLTARLNGLVDKQEVDANVKVNTINANFGSAIQSTQGAGADTQ